MESDIDTGKEQIEQALAGLEKLRKELAKLAHEIDTVEVRHTFAYTSLRPLTARVGQVQGCRSYPTGRESDSHAVR